MVFGYSVLACPSQFLTKCGRFVVRGSDRLALFHFVPLSL